MEKTEEKVRSVEQLKQQLHEARNIIIEQDLLIQASLLHSPG